MQASSLKLNYTAIFGWIVFCVYLGLRCLAWNRTVLLEDPDSIGLMNDMRTFLSFDLKQIIDMHADAAPFYPFFGALFSLPGWSIEFGARLCSMMFSVLLFISVLLIGKRIAQTYVVLFGLLILSFHPVFIPLSYSILTEPSYLAVCYVGLWLFLVWYKNPRLWHGVVLGVVFGMSFLSRTEGLLYIVVIPFIQAICFLLFKPRKYSLKRLTRFVAIYILCFSAVVGPQIWRVSQKLGQFAINGRQVWNLILKEDDQKLYHQKILGLDYSPKMTNLKYIQSHPEMIRDLTQNINMKNFVKNSVNEFDILYQKNLGLLIGPFGFMMFAAGFLALFQGGYKQECFIFLIFIGASLIAPLIHNVTIRHIAIMAPLIFLIEGIGIAYLTSLLCSVFGDKRIYHCAVPFILLVAIIGAYTMPLKSIYLDQPKFNFDYNPATVRRLAVHLNQFVQMNDIKAPKIVSRKANLAFYAQMEDFSMPYASYPQFVEYCILNDVNFVFFEHRLLKKYPFYNDFTVSANKPGFHLIHQEADDFGENIEIYQFNKSELTGNNHE